MTEIIVLTRSEYQDDIKEAARLGALQAMKEYAKGDEWFKPPVDYSVKEARVALAEIGKPPIDYKTFRKHLTLNGIQPYRKVGRIKYYLHSDLFKSQTFR